MSRLFFIIMILLCVSVVAHGQSVTSIIPTGAPHGPSAEFQNSGSGAATEDLGATVGRIFYADQYGTSHDGMTDDTGHISDALNAAASLGGGTVILGPYQYLISPPAGSMAKLEIPSYVCLAGGASPGGFRKDNNYTKIPYTLKVASTYTVLLDGNSCLRNLTVINSNMPISSPTDTRGALTLVGNFLGAGITTNTATDSTGGWDTLVDHVNIFGFKTCYVTSGHARPVMRNVYGDCTNGMSASGIHDIGTYDHVEWYPFLTATTGFSAASYNISAISMHAGASPAFTVTYSVASGSLTLMENDIVWISGVTAPKAVNGKWRITNVNTTTSTFDLCSDTGNLMMCDSQASPTFTGTTTSGSNVISNVGSESYLAIGQTISGSNIGSGAVITNIWPLGKEIIVSAPSTASGSTSITATNPNYSCPSPCTAINVDANQRAGIGYEFTDSEEQFCINCFVFGFNAGAHIGQGAGWTQLIGFSVDNNIKLMDPTSYGIIIDGSSYGTNWNGGVISVAGNAVQINNTYGVPPGNTNPHMFNGVKLGSTTGTFFDLAGGSAVVSGGFGSSSAGTGTAWVGSNATGLILSGANWSDIALNGTTTGLSEVTIDLATTLDPTSFNVPHAFPGGITGNTSFSGTVSASALSASAVSAAGFLSGYGLVTAGTAPTVTIQGGGGVASIGPPATTAGTVALDANAHNAAFTVTVTTGSDPGDNNQIFNVVFASPHWAVKPKCNFAPGGATAGGLAGATGIHQSVTAGNYALVSGATHLTPGTMYAWDVTCVQ